MGFLSDLLFGSSSTSATNNFNPRNNSYSRMSDEDDYYEDLHCDAMSGDQDAINEMREEFEDDWEGEY